MKILNPSFPQNEDNYRFKPDMLVYVPVMEESDLFDDICPALCNIAYLSEESAKTHFWIKNKQKGDKVSIKRMSVAEFLQTHDWSGMNPFEALNKLEFRMEYIKRYPGMKEIL